MRRKFGNKFSGGYHSKKEHRRADELRLMDKVGAISRLKEQVEFELIPKQDGERAVKYIADFTYYECDGSYVVEDVKSDMTRKLPAYIIKRKLMLWLKKIRIKQT
jgi:hypothetical protein